MARKESKFEKARADRLEVVYTELEEEVSIMKAKMGGAFNSAKAKLESIEEEVCLLKASWFRTTKVVVACNELKDVCKDLFNC